MANQARIVVALFHLARMARLALCSNLDGAPGSWVGNAFLFPAPRALPVRGGPSTAAPVGKRLASPTPPPSRDTHVACRKGHAWKRQWLHEGEQMGCREGQAALFTRQLERRFGARPDWAKDRIALAGTVEFEEWSLRVLDTESLDDILG